MRRMLALGAAALATAGAVALPAAPASAAPVDFRPTHGGNHNVGITVNYDILDDEWGSDERKQESFNGLLVITPLTPSQVHKTSSCAGGEVRAELKVEVQDRTDGGLLVKAEGALFEGTSCGTNDREQTRRTEFIVPAGQTGNGSLHLENDEWRAHDWANITFSVSNRHA
jgi:hypothetical protein